MKIVLAAIITAVLVGSVAAAAIAESSVKSAGGSDSAIGRTGATVEIMETATNTSSTSPSANETTSTIQDLTNSTTAISNSTAVATTTSSTNVNSTTSTSPSSIVAGANSTEGLTLQTYLPASASLGDNVNITALILSFNQTTISSISGKITVRSENGSVVFTSLLVPFQAGSVKLSNGQRISFQFLWNTSENYLGVVPRVGSYTVTVSIQFIGMQPLTSLEDSTSIVLSQ